MKKIDNFIKYYLIFVGITLWPIFIYSYHFQDTGDLQYPKFLNDIFGIALMGWIIGILYFSTKLILSTKFRSSVLGKVFNMKNRDEREQIMANYSAKHIFLLGQSLLIALLFLSSLQISVFKPTPEQSSLGQTGKISLGFRFNVLEDDALMLENSTFNYKTFPLSKEGLLLLFILWQVFSYRNYYRQLIQKDISHSH